MSAPAKTLLVATGALLVALPIAALALGTEAGEMLALALPAYVVFAAVALVGAALGLAGQRAGALSVGVLLLAAAFILFSNTAVPFVLALVLLLGAGLPHRRAASSVG